MVAGAFLNDIDVVQMVVQKSQQVIHKLAQIGMPFTTASSSGQWHLTQEGGHTHRRIVHVEDATGKALHDCLIATCRARDNITFFEHWIALDLIDDGQQILGARFIDTQTNRIASIYARKTVLATGGASRAYRYSTNPDVASGDGIAMAWRAGCRVTNCEFNQFHPTCLYHPTARLLLTEAIRGEGGLLRLKDGTRFMPHYHPQAELAPRDIVARAIDTEMKRTGEPCVFLDISHADDTFIAARFPTLLQQCLHYGFDMRKEPLPIVPAAHYTCGGVMTDRQGLTDRDNLYAIGEVAWSGLHGANRLASNSLLECLVFSEQAAHHLSQSLRAHPVSDQQWPSSGEQQATIPPDSATQTRIHDTWEAIRQTMWDYVGIYRSTNRLLQAQEQLKVFAAETEKLRASCRHHPHFIELENLCLVSQLIVTSALLRQESRGLHFTEDYPTLLPEAKHTILTPVHASNDVTMPNGMG
jgi:L-aspartate oxidase